MAIIEGTPRRLYLMELSTAKIPLGSGSTMAMVSGCYLIETSNDRHILVDSGYPADVPMPSGMAPVEHAKSVLEHLDDLGLRPDDIDIVICTHFDIDHAGYLDCFTKAELFVQRTHDALARSGDPRFASGRHHWDHPALRYRLLDGDTELLDGLTLLETSGHTTGHQSVLVRLPKAGKVLLAIDAVMMERLFTPDRKAWPADENEEQLRASTQKLLDLVERERVALVVFGHDGQQWQTLRKAPAFYD